MANTVMHFEIPADDVTRAKAFYEKTFGWTIKAFPMPAGQEYFGVTAKKKGEPGIDGGMMKRQMPSQPFMNYITVQSIDAMSKAVQANGGIIVLPKQAIGQDMGWIAAFKDPENNIVGLHEAPAPPPRKRAPQKAVKRTVKKVAKKVAKKKRRR